MDWAVRRPPLLWTATTMSAEDVGGLISQAESLIKSFNPSISTVDAHVRDVLGEVKEGDEDKVFVQQCFYGCQRYKKMLKVFLSSFYFNNSSRILRSDYTKYMILAYLTLFRMEEMGMKRFKFIMSSQDPTKVHHFLGYLFDLHNINVWLKDEWVKVLDRQFVEGTLIANIKKRMPAVKAFLEATHDKAFGTMVVSRSDATMQDAGGNDSGAGAGAGGGKASESTGGARRRARPKFNAPNITKPRPRMAPEPIAISQTAAANPVPNNLNNVTIAKLDRQREERLKKQREKVEEKYNDPSNQPFRLHETSSKLDQVAAEVEAERMQECTFGDDFVAQPAPRYPAKGATVKLNAAAVLREDAIYKKKQEQDAALIKEYESALRDSTAFYQWQTTMREKDDAKRRQQVERRRLEMVASQKEAVEAAERRRMENKLLADAMKAEGEVMLLTAEAEKEAHLEACKTLVEEVKAVRQTAPREAQARVFEEKVRRREQLTKEKAEAWAKFEEEKRIEQERKDDLIRQIRALERVPKQRVKMFDPTESSGVGLLEEMSLVELKERLELNKARYEEEEEERRRLILRRKREKEVDLRARVKNISRIRNAASAANREARARRKKAEADKLEAERQERARGNLEVANRIIAKKRARRKEEEQLAAEAERIAKQRMFLGAAKAAIEERHFEQQMLGAERQVMKRQADAQQAAKTVEEIKHIEKNARRIRQRAAAKQKKESEVAAARSLDAARRRMYAGYVETMNEKKEIVRAEKTRHMETIRIRDKLNPYAAERTKEHIDMGRTATMRRTGRLRGTLAKSGKASLQRGDAGSVASQEVLQWAAMG